jgi:chaperonin cofactor prefoldin
MGRENGLSLGQIRVLACQHLAQRLTDAKQAAESFEALAEDAAERRKAGKAAGFRKRAKYWRNVASGLRWTISRWPKR